MQTALFGRTLAAALLLAWPVRGDETPPTSGRTSSLSWIRLDGAESCIATQRLAQSVEERLARPVFVSASQADISVEGHVERKAGRWQAWLSVRDAKGALLGSRHLESEEATCDALSAELAFVVAVMIDPDAALRGPPSSAPAPVPPPPPSPPTPGPPPEPRVVVIKELVPAAAPPKEPWRFEVDAGPAMSVGLVPGAGFGLAIAAAVEPPGFWAMRASGTTFLNDTIVVSGGAHATFSLTYGDLALCPLHRGFGRARTLVCAGAQVGTLRGTGSGFPVGSVASESLEVNVVAEGEVAITLLPPVVALVGVSVIVPTQRQALTYTQADGTTAEVFRTSSVAGAGQIGLGVSFL